MEINAYLLRERLPIITLATSGPVGTAATTVDVVSHLGVTASVLGLTFTLPVPADVRSGRDLLVTNSGTNTFVILGVSIAAGQYGHFVWDQTDNLWQSPGLPTASAADFFRSGSLTGLMPDGTTDVQDAIYRSGQVVVDTGVAGDGGLTLDDLRSRNSAQLAAGDAGVTDVNMTAIGVDITGKIRLSNAVSYPDLRATNPNPQDFAAGEYHAFKQSATVGLTGAGFNAIPTYVGLTTTRRFANATDFSGGPVIQRVFIEDGRSYYRVSTGITTWGAWNLEGAGHGDVKFSFLTVDHSGWFLLNGRLKTTLSAQQQTVATALGIGVNLPNAANAYFSQGGAVGTVSQSNTKVITQANLPNVNLTAASAGNHNHTSNATGANGAPSLIIKSAGGSNTSDGTALDATVGEPDLVAAPVGLAINNNGAHTHNVPLGGLDTPFDVRPLTMAMNSFVYLGTI